MYRQFNMTVFTENENKMQFKAYIYWKDQLIPEVRRFEIDENMATNFTYLVVKLQVIHPALKQKRYTISWKDEEGDNVSISSNEEMMIALSCMTNNNLRKLYVHCSDTKPWQNNCDVAITGTSNIISEVECPTPLKKPISSQVATIVKENISNSKPKNHPQQLQPESHHIKPHIDKAIKQMLLMGFTNNDGWITQLLEMTNGDIVPVIELLQPINAK